jgi:membrane protein required for colicin V production
MTLDLAVLAVLAIAALLGAATGALRQLVSLGAVVLGVLAARAWTDDVAAGLARTLQPGARLVAPLLLFLGVFALASLAGAVVLRLTGVSRVVRGPADRGAGAILGGVKGLLAAWALLSALALAGKSAPDRFLRWSQGSEALALCREHNLVRRLRPEAAAAVERALEAARRVERSGGLARDPESARLLAHPRVRALQERAGAAGLDPTASALLLEDPEIRALVERLAGRSPPAR